MPTLKRIQTRNVNIVTWNVVSLPVHFINQTLWCWDWNILWHSGQYYNCWYPGSLCPRSLATILLTPKYNSSSSTEEEGGWFQIPSPSQDGQNVLKMLIYLYVSSKPKQFNAWRVHNVPWMPIFTTSLRGFQSIVHRVASQITSNSTGFFFNNLFQVTPSKKIKAPYYRPFVRGIHWWFSSQKIFNTESVSMSLKKHVMF